MSTPAPHATDGQPLATHTGPPWLARPARTDDVPALATLCAAFGMAPGAGAEPAPGLPQQPHEQLLVVQAQGSDATAGDLLACLRLRPAIGLALPRLWYHVGCTVHAAPELGLFHHQRTLLLGHDHTGASEWCDIAWNPQGQPLDAQAAVLRLLLGTAVLRMASQRAAYAQRLIVELPGPRDAAGQSPFWQGLGRHFYAGDPGAAARQHGLAWRSHVAALLPRQPLYVEFLPPAAQAAIGQVHPQALLLRELLEAQGLRYGHHVNLEDAGPVLDAEVDDLHGLGQARRWTAQLDTAQAGPGDGDGAGAGATPMLVMTQAADAEDALAWRSQRCAVRVRGQVLLLHAADAAGLGLVPGDTVPVWAMPLGAAGG